MGVLVEQHGRRQPSRGRPREADEEPAPSPWRMRATGRPRRTGGRPRRRRRRDVRGRGREHPQVLGRGRGVVPGSQGRGGRHRAPGAVRPDVRSAAGSARHLADRRAAEKVVDETIAFRTKVRDAGRDAAGKSQDERRVAMDTLREEYSQTVYSLVPAGRRREDRRVDGALPRIRVPPARRRRRGAGGARGRNRPGNPPGAGTGRHTVP